MAATMAAGMTPPLAIALATLFANRYTAEEREAGGATGILGLAFITEGAIPFVARDPLRMIPFHRRHLDGHRGGIEGAARRDLRAAHSRRGHAPAGRR